MKILSLRRLPLGFVLAVAAGLAVLLALGTWQVERLGEKQALLARIETGLAAQPVALSRALERLHGAIDVDFTRVRLSGRYKPGPQFHLFSQLKGMTGWRLVAVFETDDAGDVLVDRGFIPDEMKDNAAADVPAGRVEMTGVIRLHRRARGPFTPDNKPAANEWFWWDTRAMTIAAGLVPADVPALVVHRQSQAGDPPWPRSTGVDLSIIPNHHLQYAITWYALAIVLIVMAWTYARKNFAALDARDNRWISNP